MAGTGFPFVDDEDGDKDNDEATLMWDPEQLGLPSREVGGSESGGVRDAVRTPANPAKPNIGLDAAELFDGLLDDPPVRKSAALPVDGALVALRERPERPAIETPDLPEVPPRVDPRPGSAGGRLRTGLLLVAVAAAGVAVYVFGFMS